MVTSRMGPRLVVAITAAFVACTPGRDVVAAPAPDFSFEIVKYEDDCWYATVAENTLAFQYQCYASDDKAGTRWAASRPPMTFTQVPRPDIGRGAGVWMKKGKLCWAAKSADMPVKLLPCDYRAASQEWQVYGGEDDVIYFKASGVSADTGEDLCLELKTANADVDGFHTPTLAACDMVEAGHQSFKRAE